MNKDASVCLQVYHKTAIGQDELIGQVLYSNSSEHESPVVIEKLLVKGSKNAERGSLAIQVIVRRQLDAI